MKNISQHIFAFFGETLIFLGVSTLVSDLSEHPNLRTRTLWEGAQRLGIKMQELRTLDHLGNLFIAQYGNKKIYFEGLPRPIESANAINWMDDKATMLKKLGSEGLPIAKGGAAKKINQALEIFSHLTKPVIVKPRSGSRSRHTTININTTGELQKAFLSAKVISRWVMVEEQVRGAVHRATVIDGKLRGVSRRDYPEVTGDGQSTILELVKKENKNPLRSGPIYHMLPDNGDAQANKLIIEQGHNWSDVLNSGQVVRLGGKVNRGNGGTVTELTNRVHPDNKELCERVARIVNDPIIGIDIILTDISRSWQDQPCAIIELNSLPFIDLHTYPLYGAPVLIADDIWRLVFSDLVTAGSLSQSLSNGTK